MSLPLMTCRYCSTVAGTVGVAWRLTPPDPSLFPQRFFQVVSFMVDSENKDKWDDAQQVRGSASIGLLLGPTTLPQIL